MSSARFCFYILILLLPFKACQSPVQENVQKAEDKQSKAFLETNKYIRERHREHIVAFANRAGWEMTETPTGLWYMIIEQGDGPPVEREMQVIYTFETRLLNGKICYSADTTSPKKIVAGKGNIEAGLEEGLMMLREGSRARFIIPPYLAHGNFGDMNKIPGSSILLTEVHILEVKR
jgi:FKBP-type peptidyl-prolyl cis-trans isomerase FkpA